MHMQCMNTVWHACMYCTSVTVPYIAEEHLDTGIVQTRVAVKFLQITNKSTTTTFRADSMPSLRDQCS